VPYIKIDGLLAASACQLAVQQFPKDGQLWFQYGRSLEKANRIAEAIVAYQTGVDLDNPGAMNNLGELYRDGKGVERDPYMAEILFENASIRDFPEAERNFKALVKSKLPSSTPSIPIQFRGKFSSLGRTCKENKKMSKAFNGEFTGVEVSDSQISQYMESECSVMQLTMVNTQQAKVVLKCQRNSSDVDLAKATLSPGTVRFEPQDSRFRSTDSGVSMRCTN
jgi:TPR repeat protein